MTQSIVNFLIPGTISGSLELDPRVFDYSIGEQEKNIYLVLMGKLQDQIKSSGDVKMISEIINELNAWSQLKKSTINTVSINQDFKLSDLTLTTGTEITVSSPSTMNRDMATALDRIVRTFRSAGWDPTGAPVTAPVGTNYDTAYAALQKILSNPTIYPLITSGTSVGWINQGISAAAGASILGKPIDVSETSLQQLLMVNYVSTGNQILFDEMNGLSTAISSNQNALSYLNSLQDLMNQKEPQSFLLALDKLSTTVPGVLTDSQYSEFEKASFNQNLTTEAKFTDAEISNYLIGSSYTTFTSDLSALSTGATEFSDTISSLTQPNTWKDLYNAVTNIPSDWSSAATDPHVQSFQQNLSLLDIQFLQLHTDAQALSSTSIATTNLAQYTARVSQIKSTIQNMDATFVALRDQYNAILANSAAPQAYKDNLTAVWNTIVPSAWRTTESSKPSDTLSVSDLEAYLSTITAAYETLKTDATGISVIVNDSTTNSAIADVITALTTNWPAQYAEKFVGERALCEQNAASWTAALQDFNAANIAFTDQSLTLQALAEHANSIKNNVNLLKNTYQSFVSTTAIIKTGTMVDSSVVDYANTTIKEPLDAYAALKTTIENQDLTALKESLLTAITTLQSSKTAIQEKSASIPTAVLAHITEVTEASTYWSPVLPSSTQLTSILTALKTDPQYVAATWNAAKELGGALNLSSTDYTPSTPNFYTLWDDAFQNIIGNEKEQGIASPAHEFVKNTLPSFTAARLAFDNAKNNFEQASSATSPAQIAFLTTQLISTAQVVQQTFEQVKIEANECLEWAKTNEPTLEYTINLKNQLDAANPVTTTTQQAALQTASLRITQAVQTSPDALQAAIFLGGELGLSSTGYTPPANNLFTYWNDVYENILSHNSLIKVAYPNTPATELINTTWPAFIAAKDAYNAAKNAFVATKDSSPSSLSTLTELSNALTAATNTVKSTFNQVYLKANEYYTWLVGKDNSAVELKGLLDQAIPLSGSLALDTEIVNQSILKTVPSFVEVPIFEEKLSLFQTQMTKLNTDMTALFQTSETNTPLSSYSQILSTVISDLSNLDSTYAALFTAQTNIQNTIDIPSDYKIALQTAWDTLSITDMAAQSPSQFFGTNLSTFQAQLQNIARSIEQLNATSSSLRATMSLDVSSKLIPLDEAIRGLADDVDSTQKRDDFISQYATWPTTLDAFTAEQAARLNTTMSLTTLQTKANTLDSKAHELSNLYTTLLNDATTVREGILSDQSYATQILKNPYDALISKQAALENITNVTSTFYDLVRATTDNLTTKIASVAAQAQLVTEPILATLTTDPQYVAATWSAAKELGGALNLPSTGYTPSTPNFYTLWDAAFQNIIGNEVGQSMDSPPAHEFVKNTLPSFTAARLAFNKAKNNFEQASSATSPAQIAFLTTQLISTAQAVQQTFEQVKIKANECLEWAKANVPTYPYTINLTAQLAAANPVSITTQQAALETASLRITQKVQTSPDALQAAIFLGGELGLSSTGYTPPVDNLFKSWEDVYNQIESNYYWIKDSIDTPSTALIETMWPAFIAAKNAYNSAKNAFQSAASSPTTSLATLTELGNTLTSTASNIQSTFNQVYLKANEYYTWLLQQPDGPGWLHTSTLKGLLDKANPISGALRLDTDILNQTIEIKTYSYLASPDLWPSGALQPDVLNFEKNLGTFMTQLKKLSDDMSTLSANPNERTVDAYASAIASDIDALDTTYTQLQSTYTVIQNNGSIPASYKTSLETAWNNFTVTSMQNKKPSTFIETQNTALLAVLKKISPSLSAQISDFTALKTNAQTLATNINNTYLPHMEAFKNHLEGWIGGTYITEKDNFIKPDGTYEQLIAAKTNYITAQTALSGDLSSKTIAEIKTLTENLQSTASNFAAKYVNAYNEANVFRNAVAADPHPYYTQLVALVDTINADNTDPAPNISTDYYTNVYIKANSVLTTINTSLPATTTELAGAVDSLSVATTISSFTGFAKDLNTLASVVAAWPNTLPEQLVTRQSFFTNYRGFVNNLAAWNTAKTAYETAKIAATKTNPAATDVELTAFQTALTNLNNATKALDTPYAGMIANIQTLKIAAGTDATYVTQLTDAATQVFTTATKGSGSTGRVPSQFVPTLATIDTNFKSIVDNFTQSIGQGAAAAAFTAVDKEKMTPIFEAKLQRIRDNLSYIITNLKTTTGTTSLSSSLETVLNDFKGVQSVEQWVKDYDNNNQGQFQTHLNNSVVASQALNDTKREELRRVMFVFEEFYKSATSLLSRLTQLLERMADSINK